ncbi:hypothetical protein [Fodinicola feengrottensis]|nr:hypothetical protein [Fodinicola feengrottensis]
MTDHDQALSACAQEQVVGALVPRRSGPQVVVVVAWTRRPG